MGKRELKYGKIRETLLIGILLFIKPISLTREAIDFSAIMVVGH